MAMHFIRRATLAPLLNVSADTLYGWDRSGFLQSYGSLGDELHYSVERVDAFLRKHARNFVKGPPTMSDLLSRDIVLVTTSEAASQLGFSQEYVWELIRTQRLDAIRYIHEYRVSQQSIVAYMAARDNNWRPPYAIVSHVLGVSRDTLDLLVASHRLADASDGYRRRVTRASLLALLAELLPAGDPRDWVNDRLVSKKPLLTINEIALNQADKQELRHALAAGQLQYVRHPTAVTVGKQQLVSPDSHLGYVQRTQEQLGTPDMAALFAVEPQSIRMWLPKGIIDCPLHDHHHTEWYETCAVKVLAKYVTPGSSPHKWFKGVRRGAVLLTSEQAALILKVPPQEVLRLMDQGELHGLRKPLRGVAFMQYQVIGYRDRSRRARRARGD